MAEQIDFRGYTFIQKSPGNHAIAKDHSIKPSRTARKAVSQPTSILQPTLQAGTYRAITKAIELLHFC